MTGREVCRLLVELGQEMPSPEARGVMLAVGMLKQQHHELRDDADDADDLIEASIIAGALRRVDIQVLLEELARRGLEAG